MNGTLSLYECKLNGADTQGGGVLKPYLMQKSLFELFELTGGGSTKISGTSTRAIACAWATWWYFC